MSLIHRKYLALWAVLLGLSCPAACGTRGLVGGNCAPDYVACNGRCIDTQSDADHCGACGRACASGATCRRGVCAGTSEPSAGSSAEAGAAGSAGELGSAGEASSSGDGGASGSDSLPDAGEARPDAGEARPDAGEEFDAGDAGDASPDAPDACAPPYDRPEACGTCETQCIAPTPNCAPNGAGSFWCVPACEEPLRECGGQCLDFNVDANNCGACGTVCPSSICQAGGCVGAYVGHVVLACMNYQTPAQNTPQTALMGNAVLLPLRNPVRILAYTEFVPAAARAKVDQDIAYAASARGRSVAITQLSASANATATLNILDYDVFLIYDQSAAPTGQMASVGSAWHSSSLLSSFAAAGGVIIGLSGGTSEMAQFFTSSGLMDVSAETVVSRQTLYNRASGDAMGVNVISPFLAPLDTCTFTTQLVPDADNIFVIRDTKTGPGAPVVVHRVIEP